MGFVDNDGLDRYQVTGDHGRWGQQTLGQLLH